MASRFSGKVAVVTGAASGIGLAISQRLATEGASVILVDLARTAVQQAADSLVASGAQALAVAADVTSRADVEHYVQAAVAAFGGIDFFFNNAGILGPVGPFTECPDELFDRVMAVNVKATWMGMKLIAPVLISRGGGSIVNTASIAGLRASPGLLAYSVSKHAVVGMTRSAAAELAPRGVRVNAIAPGFFLTALNRDKMDPQRKATALGRTPTGRFGELDELVNAALYLASPGASFTTGDTLRVDGGYLANGL
jgi:NAD(P)-dependent dehydrogenase (short-subunit alcohol dehydrogenase family)